MFKFRLRDFRTGIPAYTQGHGGQVNLISIGSPEGGPPAKRPRFTLVGPACLTLGIRPRVRLKYIQT